MTDNSIEEPTGEVEQTPAEIDLNSFLSEQERYARDVNAEFEARGVSTDSPEWTQWCDELAEWNEAVAASRGDDPPA